MADLKKAKDIAMNEMFMDGDKYSDEYLNVSKQINNIIKEIKDPTSPKHVLDNIDITSSSLANYMILYINRSASQHCYLSNLRKGKCPKTPVAFKTSPKFDDSQNKAIQRAPEILKKPPMNILKESEFFTNFFLYFRPRLLSAPNPIIEYESLLFNIKRLLHAIINNVKREKDYLLNKNCKTVSFVYTNEYVILCTEVILSAIFFFIIFNPHISRGETLEEFFGDLNYVCDILSEKDKRTGLQNFLKKLTIDAKLPFDMDVRVEALTHNADLIYAHFATLNSIDDILVEELGQGTYTPFDNSIIKAFDKISTTNEIVDCIENIMKGKNLKKKTIKKHLENVQLFLSVDNLLLSNYFSDPKSVFQNFVAFQEIYLSDLKYNRRTAKYTVGQIAKGNEKFIEDIYNNTPDYLFIRRKMVRGALTILNMSDEYKTLIKIEKKCREIFLKPYHVIYDVGQMYLAYTITIYILDKLNEIVAKNIHKQRGLKFISEY